MQPRECDAVLIETTYADRLHRSQADTLAEFRTVIQKAVEAGGVVMIPSFALERAQVVLYYLNIMMREGQIQDVDVYVDSPMAAKMTRLYEEGAGELKDHCRRRAGGRSRSIRAAHSQVHGRHRGVQAIERSRCCAIVLAGAGMMTGGRILITSRTSSTSRRRAWSWWAISHRDAGAAARRRSQAGSHPRPGDRRCGRAYACDRRPVRMPTGTIFSAGWKARARRTPISSMASRRSCRASPDSVGRGRRADPVERRREYDLTDSASGAGRRSMLI